MNLLKNIYEKGIVDSLYFIIWRAMLKLFSLTNISLLRLRGYIIDFSVELGHDVYFFESRKCAIIVGKQTQIGSGVRIKAGFDGKIRIGKGVLVDDYSFISAQESIEIDDETMIAAHVYIVDFNHIYPLQKSKKNIGNAKGYIRKKIKIGKYVWIGTHAVILPGVTIGDGAVIGAGAVVTKSIPSKAIAVGNPARVIKLLK